MIDISSTVMSHLKNMCEIGPRPIGSQANHKAGAYIKKVFLNCGLLIEEQEFTCPDWQEDHTNLVVHGTSLQAVANPFSPSCDITAVCVPAGTLQELESAAITDKIALLYGDLTKRPLSPKENKVYCLERDQKIVRMVEDKNPAAVIAVSPQKYDFVPVIEDWDFYIPSVTVPAEVGLLLMKSLGQLTQLVIVSHRAESCGSTIIGTHSTKERIVLCAHYDTKVNTPGVLDNGSGVAVLLTLAELLAQRVSTSVEFVAFNDEEYNGLGDFEYVHRRNQFESVRVAINVDGVGQRLGSTSIAMMENSEAFKTLVTSVRERYPGIVWVDPWPQSNHSTFSARGVPCIAVSSVGTNIVHTPSDTLEWMSAKKLTEVVLFIADILDAIGSKSLDWFRK